MAMRHLTMEDIQRFELASNPALSPDGTRVVYQRTVPDPEDNTYRTHLYMAPVDGSEPARPLTTSGSKNTGPVWSPDGKVLAFISNRSHGSQAWLLKLDGGEAVRLTHFRRGITSLRWSSDGATLFGLVSAPFDGDVETFDSGLSEKEARTQFEKEDKEWAEGAKRYRHLYYKMNGIGLRNHRAAQLVAVDVKTGAFRQLTRGEMPVSAPAVSPDGSQVAFVSNRHPNREIEQQEHQHVYIVPTGGGELRLLTDKVSARDAAWSPDGRYLAVFGSGEELYRYRSAVQTKLFLVSADGSSVEDLTDGFPDSLSSAVGSDLHADGSAPGPIWSADGRAVFAISGREGRAEVVRIPVGADGRRAGPIGAVIGGDREVYAFATLDGRRFVALYGTPTSPSQVVTVDVPAGEGGRPRPHRAVTAAMEEEPVPPFPAGAVRVDADNAWLSDVELSEPRPFWYTSADDWRAEGWVIPPPGFEPGRKYPVVLEIHGGPQTCYGYQMFHEMQWLAAQGYAVVYTNPRGSTSYGQEFVNPNLSVTRPGPC